MKEHLQKQLGKPVALYTQDGVEVGILEEVTDKGVKLRPLPKQNRNGLDVEHVFFGGGFYPWGGIFGGAGIGVGVGAGFGTGFFGGGFRPFFPYGGYRPWGFRPFGGGFLW